MHLYIIGNSTDYVSSQRKQEFKGFGFRIRTTTLEAVNCGLWNYNYRSDSESIINRGLYLLRFIDNYIQIIALLASRHFL
jgi:hypothetical protein